MSYRFESIDELKKSVSPDFIAKNPHIFGQGTPPAPKLVASGMNDDEAYQLLVRGEKPVKQNKYHVAPAGDRTYKGMLFASKREASKCAELDLDVIAGEIDFYLRQVPFDLGAGVKYVADFVTFKNVYDHNDGPAYLTKVIEVKMWRKATSKHPAGFFYTPEAKLKMKLFKEKYPDLELEICK